MTNLYKKLQQKGWSDRSHQAVSKDLDRLETETKKQPSGKWRKKYKCKRNKGDHEFELTLPESWHYRDTPNITIEEYYKQEEKEARKIKAENESRGRGKIRYRLFGDSIFINWKCVHCGKKEWESSNRPNKKIRAQLKKPIKHAWLLNVII